MGITPLGGTILLAIPLVFRPITSFFRVLLDGLCSYQSCLVISIYSMLYLIRIQYMLSPLVAGTILKNTQISTYKVRSVG